MPNPRKHDPPTGSNNFSEIWSRVSKLSQNRLRTNKSGKSQKLTPQSSPSVRKSPHSRSKDSETPKRRARGRYTGLNNTADSPGDGDILQDIIWDPASPTPARSEGPSNTRVVEISDIVNRIAPKDAQHVSVDSPLLQWIGDSAVPCTPEVRPPRARKKSTRKSSVDDLMQLARQFDINMHQQDREKKSTEHTNNTINNNNRYGEEPKCPTIMTSSAHQVEAELNALFDGPTQRITGRLSQGSTASTCSQEVKVQVGVSHLTADDLIKEWEVKPGGGIPSGPTARTGEEVVGQWNSTTTVAKDEDFDWEDDDLLNDPIVLEITQNPEGLKTPAPKPSSSLTLSTDRDNTQLVTDTEKTLPPPPSSATSNPTGLHSHSVWKGTSTHPQPSNRGVLTGPCPKLKPTSRSTFLLEPNPCFQVSMAPTSKEAPRPCLTVGEAQPERPRPGLSAAGRCPSRDSAEGKAEGVSKATTPASRGTPAPVTAPAQGSAPTQATDSTFKDISDEDLQSLFDSESLWNDDEGDDDELLYQVCDDVERISNSQPQSGNATVTTDATEVRVQESKPKAPPTAPLAIAREGSMTMDRAVGATSNRQSTTRSNSAPGDRSSTPVNFQGSNIPVKAGNVGVGHHTVMSQSHPGSGEGLGKLTQLRGAPGWGALGLGSLGVRTFQAENSKTVMPRTVSARTLTNSNSHHASSFKRHLSDSDAIGNKVFVSSQMTGRCTEEEIERKKQEAIARRRSRQTSLKAGGLPP